MNKKRFFFVLSLIISTLVLLGPTLEVSSVEKVIEKVLSYATVHQHDDPLIEIEPLIFVKKSNLEGIVIEGKTYFYSLFPHSSFDPVALGKVNENEVTVIYDDENATIPVIIYTIN